MPVHPSVPLRRNPRLLWRSALAAFLLPVLVSCTSERHETSRTVEPVKPRREAASINLSSSSGGCVLFEDASTACYATHPRMNEEGLPTADPTALIPFEGSYSQVSVGYSTACGVTLSSEVACWGDNRMALLGTGIDDMPHPRPEVVKKLSGVTQVAVGHASACAVKSDGSLWCWGSAPQGQGNKYAPVAPTKVPGLRDVVQVSGDSFEFCATNRAKQVLCFADGTTFTETPEVVEDIDDAVFVSVGSARTCVLHATHKVSCWEDDPTDAEEVTGLPEVSQVSSSATSSCAIALSGKLWCWGPSMTSGQGPSKSNKSVKPHEVPSLPNVKQVAAGAGETCAVDTAGSVWCWGDLIPGSNYDSPHRVFESYPLTSISIDSKTCAATTDSVWCIGDIIPPAPGTMYDPRLRQIPGITSTKQISLGFDGGCALDNTGSLSCWGTSVSLDGPLEDATRLTSLPKASSVAVGSGDGAITCIVSTEHEVWCWGAVSTWGLAPDSEEFLPPSRAVKVPALQDVAQLSVVGSRLCAVTLTQDLRCLGAGYSQPTSITAAGKVTGVATGLTTCVVSVDAAVWCWGSTASGQVGVLSEDDIEIPTRVQGLPPMSQVASATLYGRVCGRSTLGEVFCWGGSSAGLRTPQKVKGLHDVASIQSGMTGTCAIGKDGSAWCWGSNMFGAIEPDSVYRPSPVRLDT